MVQTLEIAAHSALQFVEVPTSQLYIRRLPSTSKVTRRSRLLKPKSELFPITPVRPEAFVAWNKPLDVKTADNEGVEKLQ
jgi:hypothetical protein